jgi:hypothetical protein
VARLTNLSSSIAPRHHLNRPVVEAVGTRSAEGVETALTHLGPHLLQGRARWF